MELYDKCLAFSCLVPQGHKAAIPLARERSRLQFWSYSLQCLVEPYPCRAQNRAVRAHRFFERQLFSLLFNCCPFLCFYPFSEGWEAFVRASVEKNIKGRPSLFFFCFCFCFFLQIVLISTYWDSDDLFQSSNKNAESVPFDLWCPCASPVLAVRCSALVPLRQVLLLLFVNIWLSVT